MSLQSRVLFQNLHRSKKNAFNIPSKKWGRKIILLNISPNTFEFWRNWLCAFIIQFSIKIVIQAKGFFWASSGNSSSFDQIHISLTQLLYAFTKLSPSIKIVFSQFISMIFMFEVYFKVYSCLNTCYVF